MSSSRTHCSPRSLPHSNECSEHSCVGHFNVTEVAGTKLAVDEAGMREIQTLEVKAGERAILSW